MHKIVSPDRMLCIPWPPPWPRPPPPWPPLDPPPPWPPNQLCPLSARSKSVKSTILSLWIFTGRVAARHSAKAQTQTTNNWKQTNRKCIQILELLLISKKILLSTWWLQLYDPMNSRCLWLLCPTSCVDDLPSFFSIYIWNELRFHISLSIAITKKTFPLKLLVCSTRTTNISLTVVDGLR